MRVRDILFDADPYEGFDASPWQLDLQGWGSDSHVFGQLIDEVKPSLIIEVGSWKGASAHTMAMHAAERDLDLEIVCIDTWLGAGEFWEDHLDRDRYLSLRLEHGYPRVYYQFLANMVHSGLQRYVTPFPQTSVIAARHLIKHKLQADMIYVDASHDEDDVFVDLLLYSRLLKPGGVIFGDDFNYCWPGVCEAVQLFCRVSGFHFEIVDERYWVIHAPNVLPRPITDFVRKSL